MGWFPTLAEIGSVVGNVAPQRCGERREVGIDNVANHIDVDPEVLMNEDVAKAPNLWPGNLGCSSVIAAGRWFAA